MEKEKIWLSSPHMGGAELKFVQEAFQTNWISPVGPHLTSFEQELSDYTGVPYTAALSSGTAAIHLALIILGVRQGDEVICSTFTFSGSCNPILYQGATPVFIDSEPDTWNMDPELLKKAIEHRISTGKKPKAIIVVDLYGMPAKMDAIMDIARAHEIPVIEDAAEAIGSSYKNVKCGTFGDFGVFSFNGNKIITTSGGGALISNNKQWIEKSKFLATQARDPAPHYQHTEVGYNYRLSNVCAGIGRGQLQVLDERVEQRRAIFDFYKNELGHIEAIQFQPENPGSFSNRWLTTILIKPNEAQITTDTLRESLQRENIESRPVWKPMHLQPVFQDYPSYLRKDGSQELFSMGLCLPSGSNMSLKDLHRVVNNVNSVWLPK